MEETVFYILGITLTVAAVVTSAIGLRSENFPPNRATMLAVTGVFALLVAGTTTFAVLSATAEEEEEAEHAAEEGASLEGGQTLALSAPEDGSLLFEPGSLAAQAGTVTIEFTNPAAVQHDVVIESGSEELARGELIADGDATNATADLKAGTYVFFCSVPGHREGGMEGNLKVK